MKKMYYAIILLCTTHVCQQLNAALAQQKQQTVINRPVASLWAKPTENKPPYTYPLLSKDLPTHVTQMLYGEPVIILADVENGWIKVQATKQQAYDASTNKWHPIEGWIEKKDVITVSNIIEPNLIITAPWTTIFATNSDTVLFSVCMGTKLYGKQLDTSSWDITLIDGQHGTINVDHALSLDEIPYNDEAKLRTMIATNAQKLLGNLYVWGGCSPSHSTMHNQLTGADCSGLARLAYQSCGLTIPRNSHAQFIATKLMPPQALLPGDFAFFASEKSNFGAMHHVLLYCGKDMFIEATGKEGIKKTRMISAQERFGKKLSDCQQSELIEDTSGKIKVYFGTMLWSAKHVEELRRALID